MKRVNKYKLTPQIYKQLVAMAANLPQLQKLSVSGKPLFRANPKFVGTDATQGTFASRGPYNKRIERRQEPVLINHQVQLIDTYQKKGMSGVNQYVEMANAIAARAILQAAQTQTADENNG